MVVHGLCFFQVWFMLCVCCVQVWRVCCGVVILKCMAQVAGHVQGHVCIMIHAYALCSVCVIGS